MPAGGGGGGSASNSGGGSGSKKNSGTAWSVKNLGSQKEVELAISTKNKNIKDSSITIAIPNVAAVPVIKNTSSF